MKKLSVVLLALSGVVFQGCATANSSANRYYQGQALGQAAVVQSGVVASVRPIVLDSANNTIGTLAGSVVGGIAGSKIGKGSGRQIGILAGVIAGGVAGSAAEGAVRRESGYEIVVQMDSGQTLGFVQNADVLIVPGQRVRVISNYGQQRVVPF